MDKRKIIGIIMDLHRTHRNHVQEIMENEGLFYGQLPILEVVKELGCCTQKEIANKLKVTPPSVTTSVKRLMKKGYLSKSIDENDQRNTLISITEDGKKKTCSCREKFDELDTKIFRNFSENEQEELYQLLLKLNESFEEDKYD